MGAYITNQYQGLISNPNLPDLFNQCPSTINNLKDVLHTFQRSFTYINFLLNNLVRYELQYKILNVDIDAQRS